MQHVIELRHGMESNCGQSQSLSSLDTVLVVSELREQSMGEESNESMEARLSWGSFHPVYTSITDKSMTKATEVKDTKSAKLDAHVDYFDSSSGSDSVEFASKGVKGCNIPNFI